MTDRTVVYRLQAEATQFKAQMASAGASVKKAADDMTGATKEGEKFRRGLDSLGGTAGKIGLVAAVGLGAAVKKAADFDQAMSNVQAATHESVANMEDLRQAALDAGASTVFSATEAASGIEELAKAGVSTADVLGGGLAGALDLAAAGQVSVAEASETAASAMTQFKLAGSDVPHIADLLAAAAGKAQGSVHDMGMALSQSGLVASQVGLSIEEATGALGAFASAGLIGSDAGTSLKTMLLNLTPSSTKAAKAMEAIGLSAYDAQGNFIGLSEYAGQLREKLSTMSDEQRTATLKTMFGNDAIRAANVLYEQGADGIQGWIDKVDDQGYAAETAAIKLDNLKGDLEELGGALETAFIGTGSGSQGVLRDLTQGLTGVVNAYNDLPSSAKSATAAVMGGAAAIGGSIWIGSKFVQGIANTREAMDNLGISSDKTSKALKGIGAAAGIAVAVVGVAQAIEQIVHSADRAAPGVNAVTQSLLGLQGASAGSNLGADIDTLASSIDRLVNPAWNEATNDFIAQGLLKGILGEGDSDLQEAKADIEALDAALAGLVTSAGPEAAAQAFMSLYESGAVTASELRDLGEMLPGYNDALAGAAVQSDLAAGATGDLGDEAAGAAGGIEDAAAAAKEFKATIDSLNAVLSGRAGLRDYEAALDDFTKALKENGRTFDTNTEKGRANQAALDNIAASALNVAENLSEADRKKFLTNAIADLRTMGNAMGVPKSEINALIALLREANKTNVKPKIDVDSSGAVTKIKAVWNEIQSLDGKTASVYIRTVRTESGKGPVLETRAEGGYITGPGTPTSDSIPAYLSNGEYVIKAAAVNKYGTHMFDRLNAMRFAEGGKVTKRDTAAAFGMTDAQLDREEERQRRREEREEAREQRDKEAHEAYLQANADWLDGQDRATNEWLSAAEKQKSTWESIADDIASQMESIGNAATSPFQSNLFGGSGSIWGSGGTGWRGALGSDISGLEERGGIIAALSAAGLDGNALGAALAQGTNADLQGLINRGEVQAFEDMFNQRAALTASVGAAAGQAAFGAEFAAANANAAAAAEQVTILTGEVARLAALINPLSEAAVQGYQYQGNVLASAVGEAIVNGTSTVARRGNR